MENEAVRKMTTILVLLIAVVGIFYLRNLQANRFDFSSFQNDGNDVPQNSGDKEEPWEAVTSDPGEETGDSYEDFLAGYRMERNSVRASEMEILREMVADPNISAEGKNEAEAKLFDLVDLMEKELMLENMLKAQGYGEAVFFLQDGSVNIVVQKDRLSERQFLQIAEIVSNAAGVALECIAVVELGDGAAAP
jgi:stage III sporulation protein AH